MAATLTCIVKNCDHGPQKTKQKNILLDSSLTHLLYIMNTVRELRKKWKSVRDNFLRDMKSPGARKKRYIYHDLMTFLIPHLDPRRWHSGEEDGSDGDYRPVKRKQTPSSSGNKEFLMSLTTLLDDMPDEELLRVRQEMLWIVETASQAGRERRVISAMATSPGLWGEEDNEEPEQWLHLAHNARMSVDECKKIWTDLLADFKNHLEQDVTRDKWKYEEEMSFYLPYMEEEIKEDSKLTTEEMNAGEDVEEDGKLPVELCQVECPPSPTDTSSSDTLTEFFINMAKTVSTFPPRLQAQVKSDVFRAVNSAELTLHSSDPGYRLPPRNCS